MVSFAKNRTIAVAVGISMFLSSMIPISFLTGCSGEQQTQKSICTLSVVQKAPDEFVIIDESGREITNEEASRLASEGDIDFAITLLPPDNQQPPSRWTIEKWGWRLNVRSDKHDIVSPCYSGKWVPHVNIDLQNIKSGAYAAKLHLWMFWRNDGPKLGIWDKTSGFCKAVDKSYGEVKANAQEDFQKYLPAWIAAGLAAAIAFLVIYVLIPAGVLVAV